MALLTARTLSGTGLNPASPALAAATATTGDTFAAKVNRTFLRVVNGGGSPINVTIDSQAVAGVGLSQTDKVVAVPNGEERWILVDNTAWINPDTGLVAAVCSVVTSVTVGAYSVPN